MLEFVTLFIALVTGPRDLELSVDAARVARVELTLDGAPCATLEAPPWRATCDFGTRLVPHRLEAVGYDADGAELARATQHVNVYREPAEATLLVERDENGRPRRASVKIFALGKLQPDSVTWMLDDEVLAGGGETFVELPRLSRKGTHVLEATLRFGQQETLRLVRPIGRGVASADASTSLTGLVLRAASPSARVTAEALDGALSAKGEALDVRRVELGPARVMLVIDPADLDAIRRRWNASSAGREGSSAKGYARLGAREDFHLMWPYWEGEAGGEAQDKLYARSQAFTPEDGGIDFVLRFIKPPSPPPPVERHSLVDAVAVAGQGIAASGYRRAVVLLLSASRPSADDYDIDEVREFLAALGVPLFVWRMPGVKAPPAWGDLTSVGTLEALESAVRAVTAELRSQRIVWVAGRHLPHEIDVDPGAPISRPVTLETPAAR